MKMEKTHCSEKSAYKIQTPGNYPEESIQHVKAELTLVRTAAGIPICFCLCHHVHKKTAVTGTGINIYYGWLKID
jgi:hypothetical protein